MNAEKKIRPLNLRLLDYAMRRVAKFLTWRDRKKVSPISYMGFKDGHLIEKTGLNGTKWAWSEEQKRLICYGDWCVRNRDN